MLPFAHLGIGTAIVRPFARKISPRWLLLGTVLPDLIDKPIFFLMGVYAHFDHGGWVPGKRGIAHTLLFLLLLASAARLRKSQALRSLAIGTSTHLLLDILSKAFGPQGLDGVFSVLFWPFLGFSFPTLSYGVHGLTAIALEGLGGALLLIYLMQHRHAFKVSLPKAGRRARLTVFPKTGPNRKLETPHNPL